MNSFLTPDELASLGLPRDARPVAQEVVGRVELADIEDNPTVRALRHAVERLTRRVETLEQELQEREDRA